MLGIVTAAAVALAVVLLTGGSRVEVGAPLLQRSVFGATGVEVAPPQGAPLRVTRDDGRWTFPDGWPANDTAVRAALRLLGGVTVAGAGAKPTGGETRVALEFEGGERVELWVEPSSRAVGGGAVVRDASGRFGRAPVDLARALEAPSADAWRSPAAIPRVEIEASRVRIERASEPPLALARVDGRWFLREPARAKADDRAVAALLGDLIDLRAVRFGGEPSDESGTDVRAIVVETDRRTPAPDGSMATSVETSTLRVLGPASGDAGETVVDSDGVRLVVRTDRLRSIGVDPGELASRAATTAAPGDVGMVVLRGPSGDDAAFRRGVLEWSPLGPAASGLLDPSVESGGVERLLSFLANARAEAVSLGPSDSAPVERFIQLFGLADEPLATIGVRARPGGGVTLLDHGEGGARRDYSAEQTPPLLRAWLGM